MTTMALFLLVGSCVIAAVQLIAAWFNEGPAARRAIAWRITIISLVMLLIYNVITGQWGFVIACCVMLWLRIRNLRTAQAAAETEKITRPCQCADDGDSDYSKQGAAT